MFEKKLMFNYFQPWKIFENKPKIMHGYRGYSRMKKEELKKTNQQATSRLQSNWEKKKWRKKTKRRIYQKDLDTIAKNAGMRGYSKLKKDDLT